MFNKEERKSREYKGTTIFVMKDNKINIELLLDIIVKNIERYVEQKSVMPEKLKLDYDNYLRILEHNHNLIEKKEDGKCYTFGVEIEV